MLSQRNFYLDKKEVIIKLLEKGYILSEIINELRENHIPIIRDIFGEDKKEEICLQTMELSSFIKNNWEYHRAAKRGAKKHKERLKAIKQKLQVEVYNKRSSIDLERIKKEKNILKNHKKIVEASMLNHQLITGALAVQDFDGAKGEFEIDLSEKKIDPNENYDPLENMIPLNYLGQFRDLIKRFTPLGYSIKQLADVCDATPEIVQDVLDDLPELKESVRLAKHFLFEDLAIKTKKAVEPGTLVKTQFMAKRDIDNPDKCILTLHKVNIEEYKGDPQTLFKLYKGMGEALGLDIFSKDDDDTRNRTGVLEIPSAVSEAEWENSAKDEQINLREAEEKTVE